MNAPAVPRLHALGDAALLCELPPPATLAAQQRIWALAREAGAWPDVQEVLPGMNNLTLLFDPQQVDAGELELRVL
uniref:carboxyltransferase domain-containing protein n=1 Tax=Pseudacidovorax intermedius TaxID=433924 RepID=UPI0005BE090D